MNRIDFAKSLASLLCMFSAQCMALPFDVSPIGTLPTQIQAGGTQTALYTVTNNSGRALMGNYVAYFPSLEGKANSYQVLVDPTYPTGLCGSKFTLQPKGVSGDSCILELTITGEVQWSAHHPKYNLIICASDTTTCAGPSAANSLNVQNVAHSQVAYIANYDLDPITNQYIVSFCDVAMDGTFSSCTSFHDVSFLNPVDVILNDSNTIAYVANEGNGNNILSICPVNADGSLSQACSTYDDTQGVFSFAASGLRLTANDTYLYASDKINTFYILCNDVTSNGTILPGNCVESYFMYEYFAEGRLAFNATATYAYLAGEYGGLYGLMICPVASNGVLAPPSSCANVSDSSFTSPVGADFNATYSHLYIPNQAANTVSICPLSGNTVINNTCSSFTANNTFAFGLYPSSTNLFTHASTPFAYIPNGGNNTISICTQMPDGNLGTCQYSQQTFYNPSSVWIADYY